MGCVRDGAPCTAPVRHAHTPMAAGSTDAPASGDAAAFKVSLQRFGVADGQIESNLVGSPDAFAVNGEPVLLLGERFFQESVAVQMKV